MNSCVVMTCSNFYRHIPAHGKPQREPNRILCFITQKKEVGPRKGKLVLTIAMRDCLAVRHPSGDFRISESYLERSQIQPVGKLI